MSVRNQNEEPKGYADDSIRIDDEFHTLNAILYGDDGLFTPEGEKGVV